LNPAISQKLGIRITGFPMRYIPINDVTRRYIAPKWKWRYLRGIQCVLHATHGLISPNMTFFKAAFGSSYSEFLEILSMPDRYIIYRDKYANSGADKWRHEFQKLCKSSRKEFIDALSIISHSRDKKYAIQQHRQFRKLIEHYYPNGKPTPCL
jgi:hypothetical protein